MLAQPGRHPSAKPASPSIPPAVILAPRGRHTSAKPAAQADPPATADFPSPRRPLFSGRRGGFRDGSQRGLRSATEPLATRGRYGCRARRRLSCQPTMSTVTSRRRLRSAEAGWRASVGEEGCSRQRVREARGRADAGRGARRSAAEKEAGDRKGEACCGRDAGWRRKG